MIKCDNSHKDTLLDFLREATSENCFFIGDIENFDLNEEFIDFWIPDGKLDSLLMRFYEYYHVISSNSEKNNREIANIINSDKKAKSLNGLDTSVEKITPYLEVSEPRTMFLAELTEDTFYNKEPEVSVKRVKIEDIEDLFQFQKGIEEFSLDDSSRESFGSEIRTNTGRAYFIKNKGVVVSSATVTAENSYNGMIIGVATDPEYRGRGYAQSCITKLCQNMIQDKKAVLLFYDNPVAGKLYKKIGFRDINKWMTVKLGEQI